MQVFVHFVICTALLTLVNGQLGKLKDHLHFGGLTDAFENVLTKAVLEEFNLFKSTYNKQYSSLDEEKLRLKTFSNNLRRILDFNVLSDVPFSLHLNEFADLALEEFNKLLNGLRVKEDRPHNVIFQASNEDVNATASLDWSTKGVLTPIRSQGQCGSCYAFAVAAALEAQYYLKSANLTVLSPQNLVDCTQAAPYENYGCDGGSFEPTYDYIKDFGIDPESVYPYEAVDTKPCRFNKTQSVGNVKGYVQVKPKDEKALEQALRTIGPVPVGIDASLSSFQFYSSGVYYDPKCGSSIASLNHAVLLIGYGIEASGEKYWLIKNSYGTTWGIDGFAKITRKVPNHCGITTYAVYPLV